MTHNDPKEPYQVPVAWVKNWGKGKIFYTNLGHNETHLDRQEVLEVGRRGNPVGARPGKGDATPNPEVSKAEDEKAKGSRRLHRQSGCHSQLRQIAAFRHESARQADFAGGSSINFGVGSRLPTTAPCRAHSRGNRT